MNTLSLRALRVAEWLLPPLGEGWDGGTLIAPVGRLCLPPPLPSPKGGGSGKRFAMERLA